ncbi:MAG TPA: two-component sensor histidine kinase [Gammaproteobacteria bacterium]|nr:two-component sensor histidine kinase [Gammaproteobacteria bacterium]
MRNSQGFALTLTLSLALLGASVLLSQSAQDDDLFGDYYTALIVLNAAGIAILTLLTFFQVRRLVSAFRARTLGSRLTLRFIGTFAILALVPLAMVYYFSVQFLSRSIDSWFDVRIEKALDDALLLGRSTLEATKLEVIRQARTAARRIEITTSSVQLYNLLDKLRASGAFDEMSLHSSTGQILASSSNLSISLVPDAPGEDVLGKVRRDGVYAEFEPTDDEGLRLRVAVPVSGLSVSSPSRVLQILYPLPLRYSRLGESVESASKEYDRLQYLRGPLTLSFVLSLTLISLMTLLMALWASIYLAQRMLAPLRDLAEGTRAVSRGDYDKILPVESGDELGVLVDSFNRMTREIGAAQQTALESQRWAESEHAYLDTVLTHLSAGVLSFDGTQQLRTYNAAAARILGTDLRECVGNPIENLAQALPGAAALIEAIGQGMKEQIPEWQKEVRISGGEGRHILICSGTRVDSDDKDTGHVVVFEDATELLNAQRDAAWGEVARRLAHEIKNPLTPIQLSAERIRNKYLSTLEPERRETLDRSTRTIVQQVDAMKTMVNAFSEYARPAPLQRASTDLNQLINDTVELFRSGQNPIKLQTEPDPSLGRIQIDPNSFSQVLNNLVINAQDALTGHEGMVVIRTEQDRRTGGVTITVQDNGPGFDPDNIDRIFEPYVSSKENGTGLGLAICRRIIEEHGGTIRASNPQQGGAAVIISLPLRRH